MSTDISFDDFSRQDELSAKDSTMKTAWVRVSAVNYTGENKDIVVEYTKEQLISELEEWSKSTRMDYWLIEHTPDGDDPNLHFHFAARFYSSTKFSVIKSKFPFGNIQTAKSIPKAVQYLVHANHPDKKQYDWSEVVTNVPDLTPFQVKSKTQLSVSLQRVFNGIESGLITPYNYSYTIPIDVYSQNERAIQAGFKHHLDSITSGIVRPLRVIYIFGDSGAGKSRLAYNIAKQAYPDEEPSTSSADNDPLQDYKGQKVLIWNEFRDSHMKYSNLLSFIDPFYRSSGKSRYRNKHFLGDLIIITSTQSVSEAYHNVPTRDGHREFRRRIQEYHQLIDDKVVINFYDSLKNDFVPRFEYSNPYSVESVDTLSRIEDSFDKSIYDRLGVELRPFEPCSFAVSASSNWYETEDGKKWLVAKESYKLSKDFTVDSNRNGLNKFGG